MQHIPRDYVRCLGHNCNDKQQCQRYLGRHDDEPKLNLIDKGVFSQGKCLYQIKPEPNIAAADALMRIFGFKRQEEQ